MNQMMPHMWGVSTQSLSEQKMEHIEFTVAYAKDEEHIHRRLVREKRCGTVEKISDRESKFVADVYDVGELIPWIRTYICRITDLQMSNQNLQEQFWNDIDVMYKLYDMEGGVEE